VIPKAHSEDAGRLMSQHEQLFCSLDTEGGPGMGGMGPHSIRSFQPGAQPGEVPTSQTFQGADGKVHFNLLGWNGSGSSPHLFPEGAE
jgi:nitrate reductase beta subunit